MYKALNLLPTVLLLPSQLTQLSAIQANSGVPTPVSAPAAEAVVMTISAPTTKGFLKLAPL